MTKTFRLLVLPSLGLFVLLFYFPNLEPYLFDEERLVIWNYSGFDAKFEMPLWHYYLWLGSWAVVTYRNGVFQPGSGTLQEKAD